MKEYKIRVTKTESEELDGEWGVIFTTDNTSSNKHITFCAIRKGTGRQPFSGCSVKHPKDEPDDYRGMHDAYKRAVQSMLADYEWNSADAIWTDDEKKIKSRFMGAFWNVMGRPGYKKEAIQKLHEKMKPVGLVIRQTFIENETEKIV